MGLKKRKKKKKKKGYNWLELNKNTWWHRFKTTGIFAIQFLT
jgi:hypothetical protein